MQRLLLAAVAFFFVLCAGDTLPVTCGSSIKLRHMSSSVRLHSHEISYGSGSAQQSVTGLKETVRPSTAAASFATTFSDAEDVLQDDANSLWAIYGTVAAPCAVGAPISNAAAVRLLHKATGKWLHTHKHRSPLSSQLEVSAYGSMEQSDAGDVWTVSTDEKLWLRDEPVRLFSPNENCFLSSSSSKKYSRPIEGQQEVACSSKKTSDTEWATAEGIYFDGNLAASPNDEL